MAPRDKFANREGRLEGAPHHKHGGGVARSRLSGAIAAAAPGARSAGRVRSGAAGRAAGLLRQAELSGFVLLREESARGGFCFVKCSLSASLSIHERVCINAHVYTHRYCIYIMHNISKRWGRDASERRYSAQGRARSEGQVAASNPSSLRSPVPPAIRICFARTRPCARPAVCGKYRLRGLFLFAWATFLKDLRPRRFSFVYQCCVCACESGASFGRRTAPAAVLPSLFWALKKSAPAAGYFSLSRFVFGKLVPAAGCCLLVCAF